MRSWFMAVLCASVVSAAAVGAQDAPAPDAPAPVPAAADGGPRTITTRVRHVSTVVLPTTETIVDVVAGDAEYWDVSAAAHLAFIRPLMEGAESNLVILTSGGAVISLVVVERSDAPIDAVVQLDTGDALAGGPGSGPVLAPVSVVAAAARQAAAAWESVTTAEATAAARLATVATSAQAALDADREAYPRLLQFVYSFGERDARAGPFFIEGMWHDGEHTFLRTRATSPLLYEFSDDGSLDVVTDAVVIGGSVYVVPRVLGPGLLTVEGERLVWSVSTRKVGP